ncbi:mast cell carboxypeptidase A [Alligator mississippiensis]|uniref:Mast cell carboxypeptidase A preproprotein n=1 Tax=Alligator mississippiensis TaxID=8496 RepID=A0A151NBD4_ALLMI|nr:mast cell carboxypeptidase A [Alligator mississippiensis]KYO33939.1 mast cell carboxypeptidase A preproprotein [Alligator mississippiensis]
MKRIVPSGLIVAIFALVSASSFDRAKVFRVKPQNERQVKFIKDLASIKQLDFWHPDSALHVVTHMEVDFHVSADQSRAVQTFMEQNRIRYEVLLHNLQEEIEKQFDGKKNFTAGHCYTKYNSWDTIAAWTARIAKKYPKLVSRIEIGNTFEQRPMYLLQVGKVSGRKKTIFMECGIHAREWISPAFCQWFVKQATRTYGKDKTMTYLLDNLNFYVLPVFNIDGYVWTWTKDRLWRKNRSNNSNTDCIGTDLNRNFNAAWGTVGVSDDPCNDIYCGTAAESEKETKAVATFIRENLHSIKGYLTIHSYSQILLFPYGYTSRKAPNHDELNKVAEEAVEALSSMYGTKYKYGVSATIIYPTSGSSGDWAYDEGIKYSFGFELRDRGKYGFLLPQSKIKPTCKETMLAVMHIAKYVLNHVS